MTVKILEDFASYVKCHPIWERVKYLKTKKRYVYKDTHGWSSIEFSLGQGTYIEGTNRRVPEIYPVFSRRYSSCIFGWRIGQPWKLHILRDIPL